MCTLPNLSYALYALLVNAFSLYIFTDYYFNVVLDKCADGARVENRYFDHIVGKYNVSLAFS